MRVAIFFQQNIFLQKLSFLEKNLSTVVVNMNNNSFKIYNFIYLSINNFRTYSLKPSLCCVRVHVYARIFYPPLCLFKFYFICRCFNRYNFIYL